jgi:hypothetical protein
MLGPEKIDIVTRLMSAAISVDDMPSVELEALLAEAAQIIQTLRTTVSEHQTDAATLH